MEPAVEILVLEDGALYFDTMRTKKSYPEEKFQPLIIEQYAKNNKLGLWDGTFLRPEEWRRNFK